MEQQFFLDIVIIFALAIAVILGCHKLKIPPIVGFLLTGVLAGPHGLGFVKEASVVEVFAEIGIVLLLFSIGMEFSLTKIMEYKRFFLIGGSVQVLFTCLISTAIALFFDITNGQAIFIGFLLSLSSTAIVLRVLDEKSETDTPHGRLIIGILIFQDIIAIPMMLVTPILGGEGINITSTVLLKVFGGFGILIIMLLTANRIIPRLLFLVARTRSRELFLLSVLTLCFAIAMLTSKIGLSLSLGAFLAGLLISESEYRHQAMGDILPFQDVFTSFFFVSIGMLLNMSFLIEQPFIILFLTAAILLLKTFAATIAALVLKMPLRSALLAGLALCQIGEFSFVLAKNGFSYGLIDSYGYQMFLAVSLLSMGLSPLLISTAPSLASFLLHMPLPKRFKSGLNELDPEKAEPQLKDHVIIIGFGLSGKQLALSAKEANIPYIILEMNPETVKQEKINGEPIHFGDATHESVLKHLGVQHARVATVVINDIAASRRVVELMRLMNPHLYILVRTRYFRQMDTFYAVGANDVIPDELGSAIEIFSRVLDIFQVPQAQTDELIHTIRKDLYANLCLFYKNPSSLYDLKFGLRNLSVESLQINSPCDWIGKTLDQAKLRQLHGLTVIAIKRCSEVISQIDPSTVILENDILTVTGEHLKLKATKAFLNKPLIS